MADYLRSELLSRLSADEVSFLTRTSMLERMCGPLCDAMLGATGSAAMLASLERSNLLLVPLDRRARVVPLPPPVPGSAGRRAAAA